MSELALAHPSTTYHKERVPIPSKLLRMAALELSSTTTHAELATLELGPSPDDRPAAGSRPACVLVDREGRRYFFKAAERAHVAAEIFAFEVRRLGRRPAIPTAARTLELPGIGRQEGMLQPMIPHAGQRLPLDPRAWTALQREIMLREHPWEWLLANLDTHVDQYVLYGPEQIPLNVDWDHALEDLEVVDLDRFTKRHIAVAPIRNALYDAYVSGDVELNLTGLRREARRVARLDDGELEVFFRQWAASCQLSHDRTERAWRVFSFRKRNILRTFRQLIDSLRREHAIRTSPDHSLPLGEQASLLARDAWQRLVIERLHDRVVTPALRSYRVVLATIARARTRVGR
jgi:hypothetical protein